ncbi:MAG: methylated-DNA--[protein]-cysteine S-methyltransferase [Methylotenera sp.]|nr:methylated-DNA--[protein]-cysteine S-methyltransferase [Methylotenera sp.]
MKTNQLDMNDDALINAPFGQVYIGLHHNQLMIELRPLTADLQNLPDHDKVTLKKASTHPLVSIACQQVMQYLQQASATFNLPVNQQGTAFQQKVWQAISAIPCGKTSTYTELAQQLGSGPRAVANACGANQLPLLVPCHRVVAKSGLGGFMQGKHNGLQIKQWLLRHEGMQSSGVIHE